MRYPCSVFTFTVMLELTTRLWYKQKQNFALRRTYRGMENNKDGWYQLTTLILDRYFTRIRWETYLNVTMATPIKFYVHYIIINCSHWIFVLLRQLNLSENLLLRKCFIDFFSFLLFCVCLFYFLFLFLSLSICFQFCFLLLRSFFRIFSLLFLLLSLSNIRLSFFSSVCGSLFCLLSISLLLGFLFSFSFSDNLV